jgi:hypothetical protein
MYLLTRFLIGEIWLSRSGSDGEKSSRFCLLDLQTIPVWKKFCVIIFKVKQWLTLTMKQTRSHGGAGSCPEPATRLSAPTRNLQNIKTKHAERPAKKTLWHPTARTCCLSCIVVVGNNWSTFTSKIVCSTFSANKWGVDINSDVPWGKNCLWGLALDLCYVPTHCGSVPYECVL